MSLCESHKSEFVQACHKIAAYGLVRCSSGNLSWRVEPDVALLSASGSWLSEQTAEQAAVCEISTARQLDDVIPTCESVFHLGILNNRSETQVVLHFQSPYSTAIACSQPESYDYNVLIEVPVYIGIPAVVPYLPPGSAELAQAVIEAFTEPQTNLAILKNHGLVTVGKDFNEAIQRAVFFEMACQVLQINTKAAPLTPDAVKCLLEMGQA